MHACAVAALLWVPAGAHAQTVRGSVERAAGGPAPYAIVVFSQNGQEKARAITDSAGDYYIRQVAPGRYEVTVMSRAGNTSQAVNVPASGATVNLRTK
jgi:protocatechuate 3,4-dioxygenase beta subunit